MSLPDRSEGGPENAADRHVLANGGLPPYFVLPSSASSLQQFQDVPSEFGPQFAPSDSAESNTFDINDQRVLLRYAPCFCANTSFFRLLLLENQQLRAQNTT